MMMMMIIIMMMTMMKCLGKVPPLDELDEEGVWEVNGRPRSNQTTWREQAVIKADVSGE